MTNKARPASQTHGPSIHDEDRLSSLPDDVLINNILSLLPIREAQRTSILARSWRYLWSDVPWLGLDLDGCFRPSPVIICTITSQEIHEAASKYAKWVDQTIDAYRGTTTTALRHFRVLFGLDDRHASKINSWLKFSLRQGVEVLELDCCYSLLRRDPQYRLLAVEPSRFPNIRLLRSLTLKNVHMPNDSLKDLLLACEFLERLDLAHVSALTHVNVTGPVSRLKHLHIEDCGGLRSIMIQAPTPDLVSFTYPGHVLEITVHHAPRLVDLRLHVVYKYEGIDPSLWLVGKYKTLDPPHDFPVLSRLKHLKFDLDGSGGSKFLRKKLRCLASLIEIAPLLQHLTLEVGRLETFALARQLAGLHLQLPVRVLEIAGFKGILGVDCEPAVHLIRASPSLEKLIIGHRNTLLRGPMLGPYYEYSEEGRKRWEKVVKKVIEPELPSKAKLVLI